MKQPSFLQTDRKQNFTTWRFKTIMNIYPMYRGTGGRILFWSQDFKELHVRLKRGIWTFNLVGTIFGGSMFSSTDPFYMLMLMRLLGKKYVVWDSGAEIKFIRPAKKTLYAKFVVTDDLVDNLKQVIANENETRFSMEISLRDANEQVYAIITRHLYAADKSFYEEKKGITQKIRFK